MPKKLTITHGEKYGRWKILYEVPRNGRSSRHFMAECICGTKKIVNLSHLRMGTSKSCGCHKSEKSSKIHTIHGISRTKLFYVFHGLKARCFNKKNKAYKNYGGRGITICEEWMDLYRFSKWAKRTGYKEGLTIERIDNDGDYCPENCKWIEKSLQPFNSRANINITFNGKTQCVSQWSRELGIPAPTIYSRYHKNPDPSLCLGSVSK